MKKVLLLVCLLALVWSSVATADVLVQSWGFESPGPTELHRIWPWFHFQAWQPADTTTYRAERAAHSGTYGLVLTHPADTPDDHGGTPYAIWGIPYDPGKTYRVSYWARGDGTVRFEGEVYWRSSIRDKTLVTFEAYDAAEWKQFTYEVTAPEDPDVFLAIWVWPRPRKTDGEAWLDDIEVWQVGVFTAAKEATWGRIKANFK